MKLQPYDVIGYSWKGGTYCATHTPNDTQAPHGYDNPQPIFRDQDEWYSLICETCRVRLEGE